MRFLQSYPKEVKIFLIASLVNSAGGSLMWPLVTMYVFDELGHSMSDAGFVILIQSLGSIFGQLLGGALYHRVGVKNLIVGSLALNALGLCALPFTSNYWPVFVIMMGFIGFCNAMSMPAIQAFIGFRFADRRGELFNVIYVANNIGVALGTALSGVLADLSYHLSFVLNGLTSAVFALFFFVYLTRVDMEEGKVHLSKRSSASGELPLPVLLRDTRIYLYIGLGTMFLWFGNSIWNTGVSPFIIEEGMPKSMYGLLWTLNGILIFVAQPLVSWIRRSWTATTSSQLIASGIFYLAAYILMVLVPNYPGMVLAMVLATIGEMLMSPAIPAFLSEHGGKGAPFYIGLVGGIGAAGRVFGPYAMGVLYDQAGLAPAVWLAAVTAVFCILFYMLHSGLNRSRVQKELETVRGGY
ncbi:MFS transporter [Paenibacillus sp. P96]|uniref:MFS transporter n=1 Tax=Paenibacillus zeirhizosphaerae TaxID=2987519 RepID=A0ABT9FN48_9BACL|nr:MFS transporter [Paenibacillus sp. P96]MDP4096135.1 MFS transporter [Paenibacillus sp. P96]